MAAFVRELKGAHETMRRAIEGASPEELAWTPAEIVYPGGRTPGETRWNSLAMLVRHTTGSAKSYAAAVAGREERFPAALADDPATAAELRALIDEAEEYVLGALEPLRPEDFASEGITLRRSGVQLSKIETVARLVAHTAGHAAQMTVLRKMLRERAQS